GHLPFAFPLRRRDARLARLDLAPALARAGHVRLAGLGRPVAATGLHALVDGAPEQTRDGTGPPAAALACGYAVLVQARGDLGHGDARSGPREDLPHDVGFLLLN